MNPDFKLTQDLRGPTPVWLRRTLIAGLIISAVAGFTLNGLQIHRGFSAWSSLADGSAAETSGGFTEWAARVEHSVSRPKTAAFKGVVCQGVITGDEGGALAVINEQTVAAGSRINGVNIVNITASNVLVECRGETRLLEPGDSFVPGK
jgi:hypothetical protein